MVRADETATLKVAVDIHGDASLTDEVSSYILRELRSIPDVSVVKDNADYTLSIKARKMSTDGVIIIASALNHFDDEAFFKALGAKVEDELPSVVYAMTEDLVTYHGTIVSWGPNVKVNCVQIVAKFDSGLLEDARY